MIRPGPRMAAFRYLNSAPLLAGLRGPTALPGSEALSWTYGSPAECAGFLARGVVDGGLIPTIEYARLGGLEIVPGVAVSTEKRVRSVIVLARRPLRECASIAVDAASRTSVALMRVLLARRHGVRPELEVMEPSPQAMLARHDAALLIADHALVDLPEGCTVHDLADEWHEMTGLPFVFAVWALRPGLPPELPGLLRRSRDTGLACLEGIARAEGPAIGMAPEDALAYLRENIRYQLGERERAGMRRFLQLAAEEGLAPDPFAAESPATGHRAALEAARGKLDMNESGRILQRVRDGGRIDAGEGETLLRSGDLLEIGDAAHGVRSRINPDGRVSYIVERNINYTNVCITYCTFCAFYRAPGHGESYVLTPEALHGKVQETLDAGGTGILLQGGHHPDLPLSWYEEMLGGIKERFRIHLHGFSPSELLHIAQVSEVPLAEVLQRLRAAGLDSIPGGGAEILVDEVRDRIAPLKTRSQEWLDVMEEAHRQGLRTSATMMMGCGESLADRITHLDRLRTLQDRTGGFNAFAAWTFQTENNPLGVKQQHQEATAQEFLKTLAVARIYLDNFPHFQSSWLTQGIKMGQIALRFGADDMGSVMLEENVVSSAGSCHRSDATEMDRVIRGAGFEPFQRDNLYLPAGATAVGISV